MPVVAKKYRILTGPENTAIAGLSMGGAQTLRTGLGHLDTFHYVLGLSSAVGMGMGRGRGATPDATPAAAPPDPTAAYPALMADVQGSNRKLKLFWLSCGKEDSLFNGSKALADAMRAKGVNVTFKETDGGHWWMVWRWNLRDFAPLLFR
jgi:enterochelin esterase family protein